MLPEKHDNTENQVIIQPHILEFKCKNKILFNEQYVEAH